MKIIQNMFASVEPTVVFYVSAPRLFVGGPATQSNMLWGVVGAMDDGEVRGRTAGRGNKHGQRPCTVTRPEADS